MQVPTVQAPLFTSPGGCYVNGPPDVNLANRACALDATIIAFCLSVFPWARDPRQTGRRGAIPTVAQIIEGIRVVVTFLDEGASADSSERDA